MLSHCFKIYVPGTVDVNTVIDSSKQVENTLSFFSGLFGGATSYNARGAWVSSSAGLVLENVSICVGFCSLAQKIRFRRAVVDYCRGLCRSMSQDCISLEIDGRLYFIG